MSCPCVLTGPPTPGSVEVSVVMIGHQTVLSVSWELNQQVYGNIEYYVMSDQSLSCNATSSSCILSPVGCGEVHTIQIVPSNEAGPGYPSSPVEFITCEYDNFDSHGTISSPLLLRSRDFRY